MPRQKSRAERRRRTKQQSKLFTKTRIAIAGSLAALALAGGVVATNLYEQNAAPVTTSTSVVTPTATSVIYETLLDKVQTGSLDPETYIDEMIKRSSKLTKAIEDGIVVGVLYDPSIPELTDKLRSVLKGNVPDDRLEELITTQLENETISDGKVRKATVFPTLFVVYGIGVSRYIVLPEDLFYQNSPSTDNDVISVMEHEADHATDFFKPIAYLNGIILTREDLLSGKVSKKFFDALNETRAFYKQFDGNLRTALGIESKNFGPLFIGDNARKYIEAQENLQSYAKTPKEIAIRDAQLNEIKGIVPVEVSRDVMKFQYSLYGINTVVTITANRE